MSNPSVFVGRQRQLAQLDSFLDQALSSRGQVCFVTGDAGAGKTALGAEFLRRAEARQPNLVAAVAMGDPQTGASDPYLIFREVLTLLTGDVEGRLAQGAITAEGARRLQGAMRTSIDCLVEFGPDLIGLLVPGASLAVQVARIGIETSKRAGLMEKLTAAPASGRPDVPGQKGIDQGQIFEQYARVLKALSQHAPLLLILDDLQWADNSSIDLLFHLARRIESSRIFIVGMYRPAEIALGRVGERHPLERVVTEIKRYYGDVIIDLDSAARQEGAAFIDALLDAEPNRLGPGFRRALLERTGGNALFVVELLRDMEEQGDILPDEQGRWMEGPELDWSTLPARAEGVIEARISRLTADLLDALKLASVQGDAFTAEVVAQIRELNTRDFVRQLSGELEKRHRLVSAQGQQRVGEQRLSQYQFQNRLFQQYLYAALDPTERAYLHEDIGRALEAIYGDKADEVATRLAWHFEEAGLPEKAHRYLRVAGEQASEQFAFAEAVDFFTRALALTPAGDYAERYALLLGRVNAFNRLARTEAQSADAAELERVAAVQDDPGKRAEAARQQALCELAKHNYEPAARASQAAVEWAQAAEDAELEIRARLMLSAALRFQGDNRAALAQAEQAQAQAEAAGLKVLLGDSLRQVGLIKHNLGDREGARQDLEQGCELYRELGDRRGEAKASVELAWLLLDEGKLVESRKLDEFVLAVERETGDRRGEAVTLSNLGALLIVMGDLDAAESRFEQTLGMGREFEDRMVEGAALVNLSTISRMRGDYERALEQAVTALGIFESIQSPYGKGHAGLRVGHALAGLNRLEEAAQAYQGAVEIHQTQGDAALGLEPQAGLVRVRLAQGDNAQALADLQPILDHVEAGNDFDGTEEPHWIYLTSHLALSANGDPRAEALLAEGYRQLMAQADGFGDENARRMFLANIPVHRQMVKAVTGQDPEPAAAPATEQAAATEPADMPAWAPHGNEPALSPAPAPVPAQAAPAIAAAPPAAGPSPEHSARGPLAAILARLSTGLGKGRAWRSAAAVAGLALLLLLAAQLPALLSPSACPPQCAGADLAGKDWQGERLVGVQLDGANLYGAHLQAADLTAATLISATLAAGDLSRAVLRGADLRGASLRGADLAGADLTSADLQAAQLAGADLTGVDLTDADLRGANLAAASLADASLDGVRWDDATRWPYGLTPPPPRP